MDASSNPFEEIFEEIIKSAAARDNKSVKPLENIRNSNANGQKLLIVLPDCILKRNGSVINATIGLSPLGDYYTDSQDGRELFEGKHIYTDIKGCNVCRDFLSVNNLQEAEIKKFLNGDLKQIELQMIRYAAGGAITVLKINGKEYVLLIRRDESASVHGGHLTTASGLSETVEELMDPTLLIGREFLEEVIIFDRNFKRHFNIEFEKEKGLRNI